MLPSSSSHISLTLVYGGWENCSQFESMHWTTLDGWAILNLQLDIRNVFRVVSHQAFLSEYFPELFPWVQWYYREHPTLWFPKGSEYRAQPLGPLLWCWTSLVKEIFLQTTIAPHSKPGILIMGLSGSKESLDFDWRQRPMSGFVSQPLQVRCFSPSDVSLFPGV